MIITPEFVFIHCQKTGGTFVAEAINQLLCPSPLHRIIHRLQRKFGVSIPFFNYRYKEFLSREQGQHAWCNDISEKDRDKQIVSIIRNPYEFYVSAFAFEWWKKDLQGLLKNEGRDKYFEDKDAVLDKYPDLLNSDFQQFLQASWEFSRWTRKTVMQHSHAKNLGMATHKHIYFFCRDHDYIFESAYDIDLLFERVEEQHYKVHFLRQENLNQDLYDFLLSVGYPKSNIEFILKKEAVNVSRKKTDFSMYYDDCLKKKVREDDAILFKLFPDYDK